MFKELPVEINELIFEKLLVEDLLLYSDNEIVKRIIKKNYNHNYMCSIVKYPKLLKYLIQTVNLDKDIALCCSAEQGLIDNVRYLIKEGADIRRGQDFPLRMAAKNRHLDIVKLIIEDSWVDAEYGQPLIAAIKNADFEMVKLLVENGANVNICYGSPLNNAILYDNLDITKFLIDNGARISESSAGFFASRSGNVKMLKLLIEEGLDISQAFYTAIEYGRLEIVKIIVSIGISSEDKTEGIHIALEYEQDDIVEYLKNN